MVILSDIFLWSYVITQGFGVNRAAYAKYGLLGHNGIDFACPMGTPLLAGLRARVVQVADDPSGYGLVTVLRAVDGSCELLYAHQMRQYVKVSDTVDEGQCIGISGSTGYSTGAHLHFGLRFLNRDGSVKDRTNGYGGMVDVTKGGVVGWKITNVGKLKAF